VGALVSNVVLARLDPATWGPLLALQAIFYAVAGAAHGLRDRDLPGPVTAAYFLCVVNLASGLAFIQFLMGKKKVMWKPRT
jgi:hypothetical protein